MPTILIADEAGLFVALETAPVLRVGCRLVAVRSAKELLARASTVSPDLLLLDADLLGPGTRSCLRSLKGDRKLRGIPIVIAAYDPSPFRDLLADTDAAFSKPVAPDAIGAALKRLLPIPRRSSARIPVSLRVTCRIGERTLRLCTKDVGSGGLFLKTPRDLPRGTRFLATFSLPGAAGESQPNLISTTCEVVRRVDPSEEDLIAGVGAVFVGLKEADARVLRQFVAVRADREGAVA